MIDTHCHLYETPLASDVDGVLARAAARGVGTVIVPAYDAASWRATAALAARPVRAAYGLHPWLAHDLPGQLAALAVAAGAPAAGSSGPPADGAAALCAALDRQLAAHSHVAVGEIGLDTKIATSGLAEQLPLLRAQLELAADRGLPVILHCRGAFPELLAEVRRFGGRLRGVLHAFSRGPELAQECTAAGLHLGLGGAVTRDRARRVRRAVAQAPAERLVLETDAPAIGLDGVLPADTEPAHVADVAAAVAALRGETPAQVASATTANARRLFGING